MISFQFLIVRSVLECVLLLGTIDREYYFLVQGHSHREFIAPRREKLKHRFLLVASFGMHYRILK